MRFLGRRSEPLHQAGACRPPSTQLPRTAVDALTEACAVLDEAHPRRKFALANLGNALADRYDKLASQDDLLAAERAYRSALELIPPGHPERGGALFLHVQICGFSSSGERQGGIKVVSRLSLLTGRRGLLLCQVLPSGRWVPGVSASLVALDMAS